MSLLEIFQSDTEGFSVAYNNGEWAMGVKNYKLANDIAAVDTIERHLMTDEVFVPTCGCCILVMGKEEGGKFQFSATRLENGKFYRIPQNAWHNAVMTPGTKVILVERPGTSPQNSEFLKLDPEDLELFKQAAKDVL